MSRPSDLPDWATNANYSAGTYSGQSTKSTPASGVVQNGFMGGYGAPAEWLNWVLNNHAAWLNYLDSDTATSVFGTGALGAAAFDGASAVSGCSRVGSVYTATQDLFYTNATLSASVTLKMAGYRLYINGTLDMSSAAPVISCDGLTPSGRTAGLAPGALLATTGAGGDGGASGGANNGTAGSNITIALGSAGGAGGNGAGAGAAAGTATAPGATLGSIYIPPSLYTGALFGASGLSIVQGGSGGGGGGGGTGAGGGGGGGGGVLLVCARNVNLSASAVISAKGSNGAAGAGGVNAGGGGGGGGGAVIFLYRSLVSGSSSVSSRVSVDKGTGGSATAGGVAGFDGANGNSYILTV